MFKTELLSTNQKENASITMSSRDIAELVDARHDSVKRTIERLSDKGVIVRPPMVNEPIADMLGRSRTESVYHVGKRDSYVIVAQLCPEFTARLVDRWQELENQQSPQIPQTLPEALRLAADLAEQNQVLQLESKQKSEQIESMESYFRSGMTAPQFAKGLNGVNSSQINAHLLQVKWLYKDSNGDWRVTSYARDRYMTEDTSEITAHGKDPIIKYKPTLLKKGAAKLYEWYTQGKLTMKANWNGEFTQDKAVGL
ncbi:Rha family transcriptional regulator [Ursidibacter arcticus]